MSNKYDEDVQAWAQEQIALLRRKEFGSLDIEHLIDEVETLTKSQQRSLKSYLIVLLKHLLKIQHQPDKHSRSWDSSVYNSRCEIKEILNESPSLKPFLQQCLEEAYKRAVVEAHIETGLSKKAFPKNCPWPANDLLKCKDR